MRATRARAASSLAQLEELLALRVLQEPDHTARMMAIGTLEEIPGGFPRLGALEQALRADSDARIRKVAARALAGTAGAMREEALSMLRAALGTEADPGLKSYIAQALVEAEQK